MKLLFISHTAMGGDFVVGSHHLAKALVRAGYDVTHVSAALTPAHLGLAIVDPFVRRRFRRWIRGGEQFSGVRDLVPITLLPWGLSRLSPMLMNLYSQLLLAKPFRSAASFDLGSSEYLIVDDPRFVGLVTKNSRATVIYRATDLYSLMRGDPKIIDAERLICARAEVLVATSEPVAEHLRRISDRVVHVITNGVDFEHFAGSSPSSEPLDLKLPGRREDRAVYVGSFDRRFGGDAFQNAVRSLPRKYFILVGPGSDAVAASVDEANVLALGVIDYSKLPQILSQCAVGLLPMSSDASNVGRSPMKLYEYAAAGLCVAATSTDELRRRDLATLYLGTTEVDFSHAVARAFENSADKALLDGARATARGESWTGKANELLRLATSERAASPRPPLQRTQTRRRVTAFP